MCLFNKDFVGVYSHLDQRLGYHLVVFNKLIIHKGLGNMTHPRPQAKRNYDIRPTAKAAGQLN
jgi:hypothetical protein